MLGLCSNKELVMMATEFVVIMAFAAEGLRVKLYLGSKMFVVSGMLMVLYVSV